MQIKEKEEWVGKKKNDFIIMRLYNLIAATAYLAGNPRGRPGETRQCKSQSRDFSCLGKWYNTPSKIFNILSSHFYIIIYNSIFRIIEALAVNAKTNVC